MAPAAALATLCLFAWSCGDRTAGEGQDETSVPFTIRVEPGDLELIARQRMVLVGTALDSRGRPLSEVPLHWSSRDPGVATVGGDGTVLAISPGQTVVEAEAGGKTAQVAVRVRDPKLTSIEVSPSQVRIVEGEAIELGAEVRDEAGNPYFGLPIRWESSDREVARVSADGTVSAIRAGKTATITASYEDLVGTAAIEIIPPVAWVEVSPPNGRILEGRGVRFAAVAKDTLFRPLEDRLAEWRSLGPSIASVDDEGWVTGREPGETEIRAFVEGKMGWSAVEVLPRATTLEVALDLPQVRVGGQSGLRAVARDARGSTVDGLKLTWTSSHPEVAQVLGGRVVQGMGAGSAKLTARNDEHDIQGEVTIAVAPKAQLVVSGVELEVLEAGGTYQLSASFLEDDGTLVPVHQPIWSSLDDFVATVDPSGRVEVVGVGRAGITVQAEGFNASLDKLAVVRFVDMALGGDATCGLTRHGSAWCWGQKNFRTRHGFYTGTATIVPELVARGLVAVRADRHLCVYYPELLDEVCDQMVGLTEEGEVVAWRFGFPPRKLSMPAAFVDVSSYRKICGVTAAGDVICEGELPRAATARKVYQSPGGLCLLDGAGGVACAERAASGLDLTGFHFSPLGERGTIFPISLSSNHGCGLTTGGEAICWGENGKGQVESPPQSESWIAPAVVATNVRSIAVDEDVSFLVGDDGRIGVQGGAEMVKLQNCSHGADYTPNENGMISLDDEVEGFLRQGDVASVHAGSGDHRCLLLKDGRPYCWGVTTMGKTGILQITCEVRKDVYLPAPVKTPVSIYPER